MGERLAVMNAIRETGGNAARLRFSGPKNQDVFMKMIDLENGKYGDIYKVSLFLHVS